MFVVSAESSDTTWAGEDDFVLVEATESGSAEYSETSSGSEAAPRPRSLALAGAPPQPPAGPPAPAHTLLAARLDAPPPTNTYARVIRAVFKRVILGFYVTDLSV